VRRGDDLSSVAVRFDVPLQQIVDLNPRVDPQSVSIGTVLRLRR
jgi:LysM repeat protein